MSCEVMGDLQPSLGRNRANKNSNSQLNTSLNGDNERQPTQQHNMHGDQNNRFFSEDDELKYGAKHVIKIFIPVSICMLIVVFSILSLPYYQKTNVYLAYTPFTDQKVDNGTRLWQSFANALILITVIAIMSVLLIVLYKKRYYKVINGWLIVSSLSLLFMITTAHLFEILKVLNTPVDWISVLFFIWNFGVIGMVTIHWKGPMIIQQCYLLFISSLIALSFIKYIPEWTIWTVLSAVSVWDLIAVLCPQGPLRILVETAQERNEQLFASLVYSSGMAFKTMTGMVDEVRSELGKEENQLINLNDDQSTDQINSENSNQTTATEPQSSRLLLNGVNTNTNEHTNDVSTNSTNGANNSSAPFMMNDSNQSFDDQGVKLGLGDFVFYSILVGKVATYGDWNTTLACFVAILIGLCLTLLLLAIVKTALPALPISITFGLIFYFSTSFIVQPFANELAIQQIFI